MAPTSIFRPLVNSVRHLTAQGAPKKFYKDVSVIGSKVDGKESFEICLDHRKLKTPKGKPLTIPSEPLAFAIAKEWDMQKEHIFVGKMHLNGLATTSLDNPNELSGEDIVNRLVDVLLPSDTILFFGEEAEPALAEQQEKVWGDILRWAADVQGLHPTPSHSIAMPDIPRESRERLRGHLGAYNLWALNGFVFGAEAVKSVLVTLAVVQARLSVDEGVAATLLEQTFSEDRWGKVEWAHDVERAQLGARLAAAVLFVHFNSAAHVTTTLKTRSAMA